MSPHVLLQWPSTGRKSRSSEEGRLFSSHEYLWTCVHVGRIQLQAVVFAESVRPGVDSYMEWIFQGNHHVIIVQWISKATIQEVITVLRTSKATIISLLSCGQARQPSCHYCPADKQGNHHVITVLRTSKATIMSLLSCGQARQPSCHYCPADKQGNHAGSHYCPAIVNLTLITDCI